MSQNAPLKSCWEKCDRRCHSSLHSGATSLFLPHGPWVQHHGMDGWDFSRVGGTDEIVGDQLNVCNLRFTSESKGWTPGLNAAHRVRLRTPLVVAPRTLLWCTGSWQRDKARGYLSSDDDCSVSPTLSLSGTVRISFSRVVEQFPSRPFFTTREWTASLVTDLLGSS